MFQRDGRNPQIILLEAKFLDGALSSRGPVSGPKVFEQPGLEQPIDFRDGVVY
jgi:hypothetical protein